MYQYLSHYWSAKGVQSCECEEGKFPEPFALLSPANFLDGTGITACSH